MTWPQASDEPLSVIEVNECQQRPTLTVQRFRRAFNEIELAVAERDFNRGQAEALDVEIKRLWAILKEAPRPLANLDPATVAEWSVKYMDWFFVSRGDALRPAR